MIYPVGTKLTCLVTSATFTVYRSNESVTHYSGSACTGDCATDQIPEMFAVELPTVEEATAALDARGEPWDALRPMLTPEELVGYLKGTAIACIAKGIDKSDIENAIVALRGLIELQGE